MVYVLSKDGKILMPTERSGKVRRMLRDGLAIVVCKNPFTIRLTYESEEYVQLSKLPLDVPRHAPQLRDFKKEKEEKKYLAQCKREYGKGNYEYHRKKKRLNKRSNKANTVSSKRGRNSHIESKGSKDSGNNGN